MNLKQIVLPYVLGAGLTAAGVGVCQDSAAQGEKPASRMTARQLARYVVTAKQDNKIIFENVFGAPRVKRVMTFNKHEMGYYNNLEIGDTIGCRRAFSDKQLVVAASDAKIKMIFGRDLFEILEYQQQAALRDSIVNEINKRTK